MENAESSLSLSEEIAQKVAQLEKSRDAWRTHHEEQTKATNYWRDLFYVNRVVLNETQSQLRELRRTGVSHAYQEKIRTLEAKLRESEVTYGDQLGIIRKQNQSVAALSATCENLQHEIAEYKQALESARADLDRANRATKMAQARAKRWADASGNLYNRLRTCRHENVKLRERIRELEAKQRGIFGNGTPVEIVATPVNNIGQSRYVSGMGERGPIPQVHYGTDPTPPLANALEQVNAELRKANMKLSQDIPLDDDDDDELYY